MHVAEYHRRGADSQVLGLPINYGRLRVFTFAHKISTLKSSAWARFYKSHPKAAERNPLSVHAGTEHSIRVGKFIWRLIGIAMVLNGWTRLQ
jgi:hypothetical protein